MAVPFIAPLSYGRPKENRPHRFAFDYGTADPGMFAPAPEHNRPKRAPRRTIAYTIPLPENNTDDGTHPQGHTLGVNALALSLQPEQGTEEGGLLFSGGRDGMVKAWDLHLPLRKTGDTLGSSDGTIWAVDRHRARQRRAQTTLRASHAVHSDWVNDIVMANSGQTVISASSDQAVRAWSPFRPDERAQTVGAHADYVKALAYSEHREMAISGGLDRQIKLWDVGQARPSNGPICSLQEFGNASPASSVYALACNIQGSLMVSGSPENIVRVWDTRAGRQLTTLPGHTDHIRAVLLSDDSELVLSGSSDTTVKLWSMRMRRCLSTYSQHSNSVWSLYSTHPRFQTFYSASRDGLITKTVGAGLYAEESGGNRRGSAAPLTRASTAATDDLPVNAGVLCVAVAKERHGVVRLIAADDTYIWTATKGTELNRWLDVSVRSATSGVSLQPVNSLQHPTSPEHPSQCECSTDSEEPSEVTRRSLMQAWQQLTLEGGEHVTSSHSRPVTGHRRNRTAEQMGLSGHLRPKSAASASGNTMSPLIIAMKAEQARRNVIKEVDNEEQYYDAQSKTSEVSPLSNAVSDSLESPHRRAHSTSSENLKTSGSLFSVLGNTDRQQSQPLESIIIPGTTATQKRSQQSLHPSQPLPSVGTVTTPESPLPSASLIGSAMTGVIGSAGSPHSQPQQQQGGQSMPAPERNDHAMMPAEEEGVVPVRSTPDEVIHGRHGLHRHRVLPNKRQVLAQDTHGCISLWDIMLCQRLHEFPATEAEAAKSAVFPGVFGRDFEAISLIISTEPEAVNPWCDVDTRTGALTVHLNETGVWNAEVHVDDVEGVTPDAMQAMGDHERANIGQWVLKRLFLPYARARVKRGQLLPRDAAVLNRWVTQIPIGDIVPARVIAQRQTQTPYSAQVPLAKGLASAPPIPRSATSTLGVASLSAENDSRQAQPDHQQQQQQQHKQPPHRLPSIASTLAGTAEHIGIRTGLQTMSKSAAATSSGSQVPGTQCHDHQTKASETCAGAVATKTGRAGDSNTGRLPGSPRHQHNPSIDTASAGAATPVSATQQPAAPQPGKADDGESSNSNGSAGKFMNRLRSMRVRKQKSTSNPASTIPSGAWQTTDANADDAGRSNAPQSPLPPPPPPPENTRSSSAPGPIANVSATRPQPSSDRNDAVAAQALREEFAEWAGPRYPTDTERTLALLQTPTAPWEQLYSPVVCPRLPLPQNITIRVFQECFDAPEPYSIYRGRIEAVSGHAPADQSLSAFRVIDDALLSFELCMPAWLTDFLLFNRLPPSYQEPAKISFVLSPSQATTLPPFPNPNARLVANRMLRARKLAIYVVDKLGLSLMHQPAPNYTNAVEKCSRIYADRFGGGMHQQQTSKTGKAADSAEPISDPGNLYVDLFTRAGEILTEVERVALSDVAHWQAVQRRNSGSKGSRSAKADADNVSEYTGRPELYLDLHCKGVKIPSKYTLATIKANIWKASSDVLVSYEWADFVIKRVAKAQSLAAQNQ
ncbi:hypothetical protein H4R24_001236 [Coemansia sp. RSA 988]|nr:hypothetical protein H4R24_001236 [Coemansia sp. RSA 988]